MITIVFFLEGPSEKEMLEGLLPKILPLDTCVRYIIFQGKQDLEKNLVRRLRNWQMPDSVFVVLRDQDSGDCYEIKKKISDLSRMSGKDKILVRIACRELESFYLGDLQAVEHGLGIKGLYAKQKSRKYKVPDKLGNPFGELSRMTGGLYQKVSGSRAIGQFLDPDRNCSNSFKVLVSGIRRMVAG